MNQPTDFSKKVIATIKKIPRGKVATYGQIAALAGKPHGSRGVAWLLNSSSRAHGLPWQRVINSKGQISFPLYSEAYLRQRSLLEREGVEFSDGGQVDMKACQWKTRNSPNRPRSASGAKTRSAIRRSRR